ncbi:MAG: DUF2726 domain-containing protein [Planctomycetaceae bacterium]|nr:DUF2726 domain-containing protein [Planctomycetaceae bacterium]
MDQTESTVDVTAPEPRGCLATFVKWLGVLLRPSEEDSGNDELPYRLTRNFLSPAELSFYKVVIRVLPSDITVSIKPRLADVLFVPRDAPSRWTLENKIRSKHVDFLLCSVETMKPLLAIELDDKSHDRSDRSERDEFVNRAFAAAGIGVLHVRVKSGYVPEEIRAQIQAALEKSTSSMTVAASTDAVPICPNCRTPMIQRTAAKGPQKGNIFWGCKNYPHCRITLPPH